MPAVQINPIDQIGRNDPCWCGSGRKFGRCHGTDSAPASLSDREWAQLRADLDLDAQPPWLTAPSPDASAAELPTVALAPAEDPGLALDPVFARHTVPDNEGDPRRDDDLVFGFAMLAAGCCIGLMVVLVTRVLLAHRFPSVEHLAAWAQVIGFPIIVGGFVVTVQSFRR